MTFDSDDLLALALGAALELAVWVIAKAVAAAAAGGVT